MRRTNIAGRFRVGPEASVIFRGKKPASLAMLAAPPSSAGGAKEFSKIIG
jgi:hypothetical protein